MLVFWEQRLVFLATPKAGSTAIESALESLAALAVQRPNTLKHTPVAQYHRHIRPYLEEMAGAPFTAVALMREPRDWLGSWYRSRQRAELAEASFEDFVRDWCREDHADLAAIGAQAEFLRPEAGRGVDRLFRYEDMPAFVDFLEDRLGCEIILPRLKVSPLADLALQPSTESLLHETAAEDFALYAALGVVSR